VRLGYTFKNRSTCIEALKTSGESWPLYYDGTIYDYSRNNRLALLGDRVLSLVVCEIWFQTERSNKEYGLMSSETVSRAALAINAYDLGLHKSILIADGSTIKKDDLAETFEAVLGAVYIDSGHSVEAVKTVIRKLRLDDHRFLRAREEGIDEANDLRTAEGTTLQTATNKPLVADAVVKTYDASQDVKSQPHEKTTGIYNNNGGGPIEASHPAQNGMCVNIENEIFSLKQIIRAGVKLKSDAATKALRTYDYLQSHGKQASPDAIYRDLRHAMGIAFDKKLSQAVKARAAANKLVKKRGHRAKVTLVIKEREQLFKDAEEELRRVADKEALKIALSFGVAPEMTVEMPHKRAEVKDEVQEQEEEAQDKAEKEKDAHSIAEEKVRKEVEEKTRKEVEEKARKEAEEKTRKEAENKSRKKVEEKARQKSEEKKRKEIEEKARRKAEEKTRKETDEKMRQKAEEQARKEAEEKVRQKAEEKTRKEVEENARKETEADQEAPKTYEAACSIRSERNRKIVAFQAAIREAAEARIGALRKEEARKLEIVEERLLGSRVIKEDSPVQAPAGISASQKETGARGYHRVTLTRSKEQNVKELESQILESHLDVWASIADKVTPKMSEVRGTPQSQDQTKQTDQLVASITTENASTDASSESHAGLLIPGSLKDTSHELGEFGPDVMLETSNDSTRSRASTLDVQPSAKSGKQTKVNIRRLEKTIKWLTDTMGGWTRQTKVVEQEIRWRTLTQNIKSDSTTIRIARRLVKHTKELDEWTHWVKSLSGEIRMRNGKRATAYVSPIDERSFRRWRRQVYNEEGEVLIKHVLTMSGNKGDLRKAEVRREILYNLHGRFSELVDWGDLLSDSNGQDGPVGMENSEPLQISSTVEQQAGQKEDTTTTLAPTLEKQMGKEKEAMASQQAESETEDSTIEKSEETQQQGRDEEGEEHASDLSLPSAPSAQEGDRVSNDKTVDSSSFPTPPAPESQPEDIAPTGVVSQAAHLMETKHEQNYEAKA
jgi:dsRNA-specific ribonuclease